MKLQVEKAQPQDAVALAELLTQAMQYKLARGDTSWETVPYTEQELHQRIAEGKTYAAWRNGDIIGTLMLQWDDVMMWGQQPPVAAYVHQLAVKDGFRGNNIGEKLFVWASEQAKSRNRNRIRIDFPPHNTGLKAYYENLGFRHVRDREIVLPNKTYTAALYEKPVGE